jgi:hypothetical protein
LKIELGHRRTDLPEVRAVCASLRLSLSDHERRAESAPAEPSLRPS